MSTRVRWLLILILGVMIHMKLVTLAMIDISPFKNDLSMRLNFIPFGRLNYRDLTSVATIEWILLVILWIVFAILLLRRSGE